MTKIQTTFRALIPWRIRVRMPAAIRAGAVTAAAASFAPLMLSIAG